MTANTMIGTQAVPKINNTTRTRENKTSEINRWLLLLLLFFLVHLAVDEFFF
jgi:hypothetical protein